MQVGYIQEMEAGRRGTHVIWWQNNWSDCHLEGLGQQSMDQYMEGSSPGAVGAECGRRQQASISAEVVQKKRRAREKFAWDQEAEGL